MPCSYIISWSVLSPLLIDAAWPWYFRIPGFVMIVPLVLWLGTARQSEKDPVLSSAAAKKPTMAETLRIVKKERIWLIAIVCISNGILKESFTIWAPMILTKLLGLDEPQKHSITANGIEQIIRELGGGRVY